MGKLLSAAYALLAYLFFLAVFGYLILFVEDLFVPRTLDVGPLRPTAESLAIDVGWFVLFGVQHSLMARAAFKRRWTRVVPPAVERATYVLVTSLLFALLFWIWSPLPARLWHVQLPAARIALTALSFAGWGLTLVATFLYDHFELFGLTQVYDQLRGRPPRELRFRTPALYNYVRHPMYLGLLLAFWSTPTMTLGHLVFAGGMTLYILIGVRFEERDLVRAFGDDYRRYQARVGRLLPRPRRKA